MTQNIKKVKIRSIKVKGIEDVYNMEVENTHCFAINNGYIVHNCVRFGTEPYWHQNAYGSSVVDYGFDIMGYLGL